MSCIELVDLHLYLHNANDAFRFAQELGDACRNPKFMAISKLQLSFPSCFIIDSIL